MKRFHKRVTTAEERALFFQKKSQGADVVLVTDGGCVVQTGKGGWGYAVCTPDMKILHEEYGCVDDTSCNRMELQAIMEGMAWVYEQYGFGVDVVVRSDSQYAINSLSPHPKSGWKFDGNKNRDVLDDARTVILSSKGKIRWDWIKGHSGLCPVHDRVDRTISKTYNPTAKGLTKPEWIKYRKKSVKGKYK